ncbi:MAG: hypothetical protein L6Q76_20235 [Polyangiaceae bacterium]|nr:hypothetical protein [Polyangiaceae bacterium]
MTTWDAADPRFYPIVTVGCRLGDLRNDVLFLGGSVVPFLLTDPAAAGPRPTKDVDLAIEITTRVEYHKLGASLRRLGFEEDDEPGAPICRWCIEKLKVDIMPTEGSVLGYTSTWFRAAMAAAPVLTFSDGQRLRVISAPYFCATKLEAFHDRGKGDYIASPDLEDIVTVIDGRVELLTELRTADPIVRAYVASTFRMHLADPDFIDALPGHLSGDDASQRRLPLLLDHLRQIAGMS